MSFVGVENLEVFKLSHTLTLDLYRMTKQFPSEEKFGLTSQIRRASGSIGANLMEGAYRHSKNECRRFASISRGSVGELKYHLVLAKDLNYISREDYISCQHNLERISKMLYGFIKKLEVTTH